MASLQGVPTGDRRRFRSGRPCLDFVHTGGEGELAVWELIAGERDLGRWLGVVLDGVAITAGARDVAPARAVRHAITRLAFAASAGARLPEDAVAVVNEAAVAPPLVPRLADGAVAVAPATAPAALSALARDAIDLFGGPLAGRVRQCAADDCGLFYVDTSRPGTRRWCSMELCGNRAKVRAHRAG